MKLLITSLPGYGHLCPLIPLARAVKAAGHEVAFATSKSVAGTLIPEDLTVFESGPDWHEADFAHDTALRSHPTILSPLHKYLAETVVPKVVNDLDRIINRWCPDVILSNEYERAGCVFAEKYNIPFVLISCGPRVSRSWRKQWHAPLYILSRRLVGLPIDFELQYPHKWLQLYLTPAEYALEDDYHEADNEFGIRIESVDLSPPHVNEFKEALLDKNKPKVLCTFGTVFNKNADLMRVIANAFNKSPYQLIITSGAGNFNFDPNDKNIIALPDYVPLSRILPYVDFCITHGGTSTLLTLLQHGKPLLLLPQGADQKINATTCVRLGLAECDFMAAQQAIGIELGDALLKEDTVRKLLDTLPLNQEIKNKCEAMQRNFLRLPGLDYAIRLLEKLTAAKRPISKHDLAA
jgi:UDP:flavonoid glycosyltransferase YjiC (YdhE family)